MSDEEKTPLTAMQEKFVEHFCGGLSAAEAARKAGYSEKYAKEKGYALLQKETVIAAINARQVELASQHEIERSWIIERLRMEAEFDGPGASHSARVNALEKLGKSLGMFTDKVEHSGGGGIIVQINDRGHLHTPEQIEESPSEG